MKKFAVFAVLVSVFAASAAFAAPKMSKTVYHNVLAGNVITVQETVKVAEVMSRTSKYLEGLKTMRGGEKGFKGFVAEGLEAGEMSISGKATYVIDKNKLPDLENIGKNGHKYYKQVKYGYTKSQFKHFPEKYKGQEIIVDKGNPNLKEFKKIGRKYGVKVTEGAVTKAEAERIGRAMQFETKITGAKTATIVPKAVTAHKAGLSAGKMGAQGAAGFSLGSNIVDVIAGEKTLREAGVDIVKDTAIGYGAGYVAGSAGSLIASTAPGAAVIGAVSSAGTAIASTTVGGAVLGAASTVTGFVGFLGAEAAVAAVGTVGTVGSALTSAAVTATAGTVIGGAVGTSVAAVTAGAAAIGAAAIAAAPVVAVGAVAGAAYKLISWLW